MLRARDLARGPEVVGAALAADLEVRAHFADGATERLGARPLAPPQRGDEGTGQARQRRDLLQRAGAAEQVGEVRLRGPPGITDQLAQDRGLALDTCVEIGEVVGGQAVAVALGLPDARRPVDRGRVVEHRQDVLGERAAHPHRVAHALPGDRVLEVPGVAGQRPARPGRGAEEGRRLTGRSQLGVRALVHAGDPAGEPGMLVELALPVALRVPARLADLVAVAHQEDQQPARGSRRERRTRTSHPRATGCRSPRHVSPPGDRRGSGRPGRGRCARAGKGSRRRPARRRWSGGRPPRRPASPRCRGGRRAGRCSARPPRARRASAATRTCCARGRRPPARGRPRRGRCPAGRAGRRRRSRSRPAPGAGARCT